MDADTRLSLERFRRADFDASSFTHREHVRLAFELLKASAFPTALVQYSATVSELAARAGAPEKFNLTITGAFLSLIAEASARSGLDEFDAFASRHPELFERDALRRHYSSNRLADPLGRSILLLPDPARAS